MPNNLTTISFNLHNSAIGEKQRKREKAKEKKERRKINSAKESSPCFGNAKLF
jgi:hypothetical protein